MASANLDVTVRKEWPLGNPVLWLAVGLALNTWALVWTLAFRPDASEARVLVLAGGLLTTAIGAWLRHHDREGRYLFRQHATLARALRLAAGLLFAFLAIVVTVLLAASFFYPVEVEPRSNWLIRALAYCERFGRLHIGPAFLVWLSLFPLTAGAALRCLKSQDRREPLEVDEERGLAYLALGIACVLGTYTLLRDPSEPREWDSMRMFLRVGSVVCVYAAALTIVSLRLRRSILSLLFALHFSAISTAALSAPPATWIMQQTWMRLFRPYLEFMYLNNAYHFYAPEPGPSSYLWFRIIFTDDEGNESGIWHKLPQLDNQGRIKHPVALEYQRYLSLTESIAPTDSLPSEFIFNPDKAIWERRPMYEIRGRLAMGPQPLKIGEAPSKHYPIPLHPSIPNMQQVNIPADGSRRLLKSFARHVAKKYATYEDDVGRKLTFKSVKIYRVIHAIPPIDWFQYNLPPSDPTLYRPFYVGNYDGSGERIEENDPYLYWLLPIIRDVPRNARNVDLRSLDIKDYARLHAGDPNWIRKPGEFD